MVGCQALREADVVLVLCDRVDGQLGNFRGRGLGDELEFAQARHDGLHLVGLLEVIPHLGVDWSRRYDGDADVGIAQFHAHRRCEVRNASLGSAIGGEPWKAARAGDRTDVDEMAAIALDHAVEHLTGQHHRSFEVEATDGLEMFDLGGVEPLRRFQAGIVDQHVDRPTVGLDRRYERLHSIRIGQVDGKRRRPTDLGCDARETIGRPRRERQFGSPSSRTVRPSRPRCRVSHP